MSHGISEVSAEVSVWRNHAGKWRWMLRDAGAGHEPEQESVSAAPLALSKNFITIH